MDNIDEKKPGYEYIKITNYSGYIARFSIIYTLHGSAKTEKSGNFPLFTTRQLYFPQDAMLIILKVEEEFFIGKWKHFYYKLFVKPVTKCYSLSGTTLKPVCTEVACVNSSNCEVKRQYNKLTDYLLGD